MSEQGDNLALVRMVNNASDLIYAVLTVYDILLTSNLEVIYIWRCKTRISLIVILFVCIRYGAPLVAIIQSVFDFTDSAHSSCRIIGYVSISMNMIVQWAYITTDALRVWGIWGRGWGWTTILVIIPPSLILFVMSLCQFFTLSPASHVLVPAIKICPWAPGASSHTYIIYAIVARGCVGLGDGTVVVMTFLRTWKTYQTARKLRLTSQAKISLPAMLIRDGSIYFSILFITNLLSLVIYLSPLWASSNVNPISNIHYALRAILLSRFILNLRSYNTLNGGDPTATQPPSTLRFGDPNARNVRHNHRSGSAIHERGQDDERWSVQTFIRDVRNEFASIPGVDIGGEYSEGDSHGEYE